jgi:hypothetical protein
MNQMHLHTSNKQHTFSREAGVARSKLTDNQKRIFWPGCLVWSWLTTNSRTWEKTKGSYDEVFF